MTPNPKAEELKACPVMENPSVNQLPKIFAMCMTCPNRRTPAKDEGEKVERPCDCFKHSRRSGKYLLCDECGSVREIGVEQPKPTAPADDGENATQYLCSATCTVLKDAEATFQATLAKMRVDMDALSVAHDAARNEVAQKERHLEIKEKTVKHLVGQNQAYLKEIAEKDERIEELTTKCCTQHCEIEAQIQCREVAEAKLKSSEAVVELMRPFIEGIGPLCDALDQEKKLVAALSAHDKEKETPAP